MFCIEILIIFKWLKYKKKVVLYCFSIFSNPKNNLKENTDTQIIFENKIINLYQINLKRIMFYAHVCCHCL